MGQQLRYEEDFVPSWTLDAGLGAVALFHMNEGSGSTLANAVEGAPSASLSGSYTWQGYGAACD